MSAYQNSKGEWVVYDSFQSRDIGYSDSLESVLQKCNKLCAEHNLSLNDLHLSTHQEYDSFYWKVEFTRPATPEEIKAQQDRIKTLQENRRRQYEQLKKEFEKNV